MHLTLPQDIASLTGPELVKLYNKAAELLEVDRVVRFGDKAAAVRRVRALYAKLPAPAVAAPVKAAKAPRKTRQMYFKFKPGTTIRQPKEGGEENVLRATCRDRMLNQGGATLAEVMDMVREWDKARAKKAGVSLSDWYDRRYLGKGSLEPVIRRRAYELMRLMHYWFGYGMDTHPNGKVFIYE